MKKPGISPQEFTDRLLSAPDIANEWPFGHMQNEDLNKKYSLPDIVSEIPDGNSILRMSILAVAPGSVMLSASVNNSYVAHAIASVDIDPNPAVANAWQRMRGLRLALAITSETDFKNQSKATINRVLGIEQPLRTPSRNNIFPTIAGDRERGYIHGTVVEVEAASVRRPAMYNATVRLGRERRLAKLVNIRALVVTRSATARKDMLMVQEGDLIRTTVNRRFNDAHTFEQTGDVIHVLNN
jgi:hypothetical protein